MSQPFHHPDPPKDSSEPERVPSRQQPASGTLYAHNNSDQNLPLRNYRNGRSPGTAEDLALVGPPSRVHGSYRRHAQPPLSREPSTSDRAFDAGRHARIPSGSGAPLSGRNSRGMGEGYASGSQAAPPHQGHGGPDMPLPTSSQEWQERGAAVGVRREVDSNGQTVIRHVKKRLREF